MSLASIVPIMSSAFRSAVMAFGASRHEDFRPELKSSFMLQRNKIIASFPRGWLY
jgi:hypothetical protein